MNTSAIQLAIKLYKHPQEMQWLSSANAELPEGITDLLRLCSSEQKLKAFTKKIHIEESIFTQVLNDFIDKVLFIEGNSDEKQLGLLAGDDLEKRKLHYQLLMKIFHPDRNSSEDAQHKASRVSQIYQKLKSNDDKDDSIYIGENIEVSYRRTPQPILNADIQAQSFYRATQKAQQQISYTKNTFILISSMTLLAIVVLGLSFLQGDKPQLVISKTTNNQNQTTEEFNNNTALATLASVNGLELPNSQLEKLLHKLEFAYEKGDVAKIKPILENTPDIKNQTDAELNAKLETLFKITNDRKMVLFNFDWRNISGSYHGEGKFLSRYMMMGDDQWLTREGKAFITAEINHSNHLKIISLQLKDNTIEQ